MSYRRTFSAVALIAVATLGLAACGDDDGGDTDNAPAAAGTTCESADTSGDDLLAEVCNEGVITVSTDPAYPPQSSLEPGDR